MVQRSLQKNYSICDQSSVKKGTIWTITCVCDVVIVCMEYHECTVGVSALCWCLCAYTSILTTMITLLSIASCQSSHGLCDLLLENINMVVTVTVVTH